MENDGGFTFYYDGEARLKRHPELRDFHEGKMQPKRGFFQVLVANPSGKVLLVAIFLLSAAILGYGFLASEDGSARRFGVKMTLDAFLFEDTVFATLTLAADGEFDGEEKRFDVAFSALGDGGAAMAEGEDALSFSGGEAKARAKLPARDASRVVAAVTCGGETCAVEAKVRR